MKNSFMILPAIALFMLAGGCKKTLITDTGVHAGAALNSANAMIALADVNTKADNAISGFNSTFLITSGSLQYYKTAVNNTEKDYFWCQALDIQMMEDVYLRTKTTAHRTLISNLLNTFLVQNAGQGGQQDWTWNDYNDDLLWAGLAFARGYQITGNTTYLNQAAYAFNLTYNRGYDQQLGGGIWWDVAKANKSGLSNNTAVMLACYLYEFTKDPVYLAKASSVYDWIWNNLFNHSSGAVYEHKRPDGTLEMADNVYNSGAFISAATHLHRLTGRESLFDDAKKAVDYVIANKTVNGILSKDHRFGTWQSEFARGLGEFVRDNNLWSTYYTFMRQNADAAWNARRTDLNVSWNQWTVITPSDNVTATLECVSAVVMLQVTPATQPGFTGGATYRLTPKINGASALDIVGAGTQNGSLANIWSWNNAAHQKFQVVSLGKGYYRLVPAHATGLSLDVPGATTTNGTQVDIWGSNASSAQYWKLVYDYDGYYKLKPKCAPSSCLNVSSNNPANGTPVLLWQESNGDNERWVLQTP
jgi:predicted alpha-1,6-mannanase (GH76 family)